MRSAAQKAAARANLKKARAAKGKSVARRAYAQHIGKLERQRDLGWTPDTPGKHGSAEDRSLARQHARIARRKAVGKVSAKARVRMAKRKLGL